MRRAPQPPSHTRILLHAAYAPSLAPLVLPVATCEPSPTSFGSRARQPECSLQDMGRPRSTKRAHPWSQPAEDKGPLNTKICNHHQSLYRVLESTNNTPGSPSPALTLPHTCQPPRPAPGSKSPSTQPPPQSHHDQASFAAATGLPPPDKPKLQLARFPRWFRQYTSTSTTSAWRLRP